jgi:outer membrane cobalamin receptor
MSQEFVRPKAMCLFVLSSRALTQAAYWIRNNFRVLVAHAALALCVWPIRVQADSDVLQLDEVIVSGTRPDITLLRNPRSVSIITRADIERSGATSIVQLLGRETGIQERGTTGNDKFAFVDLRGQGDTAVSNVVVLVDGARLNAPDLSGPDLSFIALDDIERIEILRGPEAVRYGNGAVGGAINIITRKAGGKGAHVAAEAGSFDTTRYQAGAGWAQGATGISVAASAMDTDGHRQNSYLYRRDAGIKLAWRGSALQLGLDGAHHEDEYGLPGPVSAQAFETESGRESSSTPHDHGESRDSRLRATAETGGTANRLRMALSGRERKNGFYAGFNPLQPPDDQLGQISETSREANLEYRVAAVSSALAPSVTLGANFFLDDYESLRNGLAVPDQSTATLGEIVNPAAYMLADLPLGDTLEATLGARTERFDIERTTLNYKQQCEFIIVGGVPVPVNCVNVWVTEPQIRDRWRNDAFDAGFTAAVAEEITLFLDYATSFRNPNVDELALAAPDLRPQQARHAEGGLRFHPDAPVEASVALFHARGEDEIYFDGASQLNRNFTETTLRTGIELGLRARLRETISMRLDMSYLNPRFAGTGETIPLVARAKAGAGLDWQPTARWLLHADVTWVGQRPDGNDVAGVEFPELPAYAVANLRATRSRKQASWFVGVTNLTDEVYATSAYSNSLYPMPGRAYQAGASWRQ